MLTVLSQQVMIVTAIAIFAIQPVSGRIFYVDPDHPDASDENSGAEDSPWRTLEGACQQARSGDMVWVKAGAFSETLRPSSYQQKELAIHDIPFGYFCEKLSN